MSNPIDIKTQKVEKTYSEEEARFEIVVSDNYQEGSLPVDEIPDDPMEILQLCKDIGSDVSKAVCDIIDWVLENGVGVNINDDFYDWDAIKHIFYPENVKDEEVKDDENVPDITITVQGGLIQDVDIPEHLGTIRIVVKDYDTDGFSEDVETDTDGGGTFVRSEWGIK